MKKLSLPTTLTVAVVLSGAALAQFTEAPEATGPTGAPIAAQSVRTARAPLAQGQHANQRVPLNGANADDASKVVQHYHRQLRSHAGQDTQKPRPMIGVRIAPVDDAVSAQLPANLMPALRLTTIFPDSPAERAGLAVNDVVTAIDGNSEVTVETLIAAISSKEPGSTVRLDVSRAGTTRVFHVEVEMMKPDIAIGSKLDFGFSENVQGQPFPRFGMRHDGKIMMQQAEGSPWTETEVDSPWLEHWQESENRIVEGRPFMDLSRPEVDPDGALQRQLEDLHQAYRENAKGQHPVRVETQRIEQRIERLEQKVDDIHRMLSELVGRRK